MHRYENIENRIVMWTGRLPHLSRTGNKKKKKRRKLTKHRPTAIRHSTLREPLESHKHKNKASNKHESLARTLHRTIRIWVGYLLLLKRICDLLNHGKSLQVLCSNEKKKDNVQNVDKKTTPKIKLERWKSGKDQSMGTSLNTFYTW